MAVKPAKQCLEFGCSDLTEGGRSRCPAHEAARHRRIDSERPSASRRGYSKRWQRESKRYLQAFPACVQCGGLASEVDHIVPHRGNQELFWARDNWQALCKACHSRKTASEVLR